jgi:hypothetical protein
VDPATAAKVLGVRVDAPRADIERAFRSHARREHPDLTGDPSTFSRVTEAREVLLHAQGWLAPRIGSRSVPPPAAPQPQPGFELPPLALWLLAVLLVFGCFVAGVASASPVAPTEPLVRSGLLVTAVVGYALTGRRALGVLSAVAIVATAVSTVVWISFGALLGGLLMAPAIILLVLHGRGRPL